MGRDGIMMKKNQKLRLILAVFIFVVLGTVISVFIGYRRIADAPDQLISSIKEGANLSIGKIRQTATRDGKKEWSLEANSARYMETEHEVILTDLTVTFFLEKQGEVHLKADTGILNTDTNDIEFSGNVVVRNDKYQLKTDRLNYENSRRVIFSNDPVRIWSDSAELKADAISYDLNANKIVASGKVEAAIAEGLSL